MKGGRLYKKLLKIMNEKQISGVTCIDALMERM
jgi:hypothetical protein